MILLRQRIYAVVAGGGGTSSMNFYQDPTVKAQYVEAMKKYKEGGGRSGLGQSFEDFKKSYFAGPNISEQTSNMINDKSTYRGASLRQGTTSTGKPNTVDNRYASRDNSQKAQLANAKVRMQKQSSVKQQQAFNQGQQSVGIWGGAKNTWNNMNNTQKGLAIGGAATVAALGTAATVGAIRNRNKRKQAERDLELERARNSRPRY